MEANEAVAKMSKDEGIKLIKNIAARGASDTEFGLLMHLANRYELDPLAREIWCIKYGNSPATIFTSRDGLLTIAHKSGQFDGMSEPKYTYDENKKIESCTISVYRKDMTHPFTSTVFMEEYGGGSNQLWKKMPRVMLLKVAESTALRKAFRITGLYTPEEFDQAREDGKAAKLEAAEKNWEEKVEADPGNQPAFAHPPVEAEIIEEANAAFDEAPDTESFREKLIALKADGNTPGPIAKAISAELEGNSSDAELKVFYELMVKKIAEWHKSRGKK